jgi:nucleoside-diphosphate-sugar epimerase
MRVLVFGSTGFLGRHVLPAVTHAGHDVVTIGRSPSTDIAWDMSYGPSLEHIVDEIAPGVAINLLGAGISDPAIDPQVMETVNSRMPQLLLESLARVNPAIHLIHASSSTESPSESGTFESEYSRTKASGTRELVRHARESGGKLTVLRVHNTYGADQPGNRFIASTVDQVLRGEAVSLRYPKRIRDFVHVDDVAGSFAAAVSREADAVSHFEVGTGVGTSLDEVARLIAEEVGVPYVPDHSDTPIDEHPVTVAKLENLLQPATISLPAGIARVVRERREGGVNR